VVFTGALPGQPPLLVLCCSGRWSTSADRLCRQERCRASSLGGVEPRQFKVVSVRSSTWMIVFHYAIAHLPPSIDGWKCEGT
jgi:hypothetical protein